MICDLEESSLMICSNSSFTRSALLTNLLTKSMTSKQGLQTTRGSFSSMRSELFREGYFSKKADISSLNRVFLSLGVGFLHVRHKSKKFGGNPAIICKI